MTIRSAIVVAILCLLGGSARAVTEAEEEAAFPQILADVQKDCDPKTVDPELCTRLERFRRAKKLPQLPTQDRVLVMRIGTLPGGLGEATTPGKTPEYLVLMFTQQGTRLQWFRITPENDAEKVEIEAVMAALAKGAPLPSGGFAKVVDEQRSKVPSAPIERGFGGRFTKIPGAPGCLVLRQDSDALYAFTLEIDTERGGRLSLASVRWPRR
jgi:hypothetical protein